MIKNVVFDMGGVLIRYDPQYFLDRAGISDPEDRELLMKHVFRSVEWILQDWGRIDEPEMEKIACEKLPAHLHKIAHDMIWGWNELADAIPGIREVIGDCKKAGFKIYVLSNASHRLHEYIKDLPGYGLWDGMIVSADVDAIKPMPEIYRALLGKYDLKAEECLFIDDMPANIAGALNVGMQGFLLRNNVDELRKLIFGQ